MPDKRLPEPCCIGTLRGQWRIGRVMICPECLLPYTAIVQDGEHSWWPGLTLPRAAETGDG